jgi:hypothetical protein
MKEWPKEEVSLYNRAYYASHAVEGRDCTDPEVSRSVAEYLEKHIEARGTL